MKKLITLLTLMMISISAWAFPFDKYTIDRKELPEEAQTFLTTHFEKAKVSMIKIDKKLLRKPDYEVKLVNGTKIEFNSRGKWKEMDCKKKEVPSAILPSAIRRHVTKKYPGLAVVKIEKTTKGYEVGLSDDTGLRYDLLGSFKGVMD